MSELSRMAQPLLDHPVVTRANQSLTFGDGFSGGASVTYLVDPPQSCSSQRWLQAARRPAVTEARREPWLLVEPDRLHPERA